MSGGSIGGRAARIAAAAAVLVAGVVGFPGRAAADQTIGPGQVLALTGPVSDLPAPVDGRLRGIALSAQIGGVGFMGRADTGDNGIVTPAAGDELLVFTLKATQPETRYLNSTLTRADPTATLIEGATRVPLDMSAGLAGINKAWVTAVPKGVPALLELAKAGFAEKFDLRAAKRVGPDPMVLYRDPQQIDVTVRLGATQTMTAAISAGGTISYQVKLAGAGLSYFSPDPRTPPPAPDRAFLILNLVVYNLTNHGASPAVVAASPLTGSQVRLQRADGTQIPAVHRDDALGASDLLDGTYYFPVPAALTTGRVIIDPGPAVPGVEPTLPNNVPVTLAFAQPATFDFAFPAAQAAPPPLPNAVTPARSVGHHHTSTALIAVVVALVAVLAAGVGVAFARRRRHALAVRPVVHSRAALVAAAGITALNGPEPSWALPAVPGALPAGSPPANGSQPAAASQPKLVVRLLGPLEVEGLRRPVRRRPAIRMLVWLALNIGRPVATDELRFALATSDEAEPSETTLYSYASHLRKALPDTVLPPSDHTGYRLAGDVEVDWSIFQSLVAQAATRPFDKPGLLRAALMLVRGTPLARASWAGVDQAIRHMTTTIESVALDAAHAALQVRDPRGAEWAINQALAALPASPALWEGRLVAAAAGSGYGLERAWADAGQALGADLVLLQATRQRLQADLV